VAGDAPPSSADLFFTSPLYADARAHSRIHPDRYVEWFLSFGRAICEATADTGSLRPVVRDTKAAFSRSPRCADA
jgi:hypothetical protein